MTNLSDTTEFKMTNISEAFLHHVWKFGLFRKDQLKSNAGQAIEVIHPGIHNHHGGPDFMNARLRIDGTLWWGHVEIHVRSSDWHRHGHVGDEHYHNVILHVVVENDREVYLQQPNDLPVLELKNYIAWNFWEQYRAWIHNCQWIPCEKECNSVEELQWTGWKDRLLAERLQQRVEHILIELERTKGNWAQITFRELARAFGFKSNAAAMELLAESIPYHIIARHHSDPMQIEALLFGQSGLLQPDHNDAYPKSLAREYWILQHKYGLCPISRAAWNFGRVRPQNTPAIRIAQLAAALSSSDHLASTLLHSSTDQLQRWLQQEVNPYWKTHHDFDRPTALPSHCRLGNKSIDNIIINAACKLQFAFGKFHDDQRMIERALANFELLDAEENSIIGNWRKLGILANHAGDSQALIQLYNVYCTNENCLNCVVGNKVLNFKDT
jgi:hypothetical protein